MHKYFIQFKYETTHESKPMGTYSNQTILELNYDEISLSYILAKCQTKLDNDTILISKLTSRLVTSITSISKL